GIFPADNPQYVVVVKMTAPQSSIYAAQTAAPVTKAILEAAIAAQNAALDRTKLASSVVPSRKDTKDGKDSAHGAIRLAGTTRDVVAAAPPPPMHDSAIHDSAMRDSASHDSLTRDPLAKADTVPYIVTLPMQKQAAPPRVMHAVPDVTGLTLRDAVRSLHNAGFRVQLARAGGGGSSSGGASTAATTPAAGELLPTGTLVRLLFNY